MKKQETIGGLLVLFASALTGLFPVLAHIGGQSIPPLTYGALALAVASVSALVYALFKGTMSELRDRRIYPPILMLTLLLLIIPTPLFFIGASKTTGLNTSILTLAEIVFTLVYVHFIGEKTTKIKLLGAGGILLGTFLVLWDGTAIKLGLGDLLIILTTAFYPFGNLYSKRALNYASPSIIILLRSTIAALCLLPLAWFVDGFGATATAIENHWLILLAQGFVAMFITKIFWYEGFKFVDISKAISLAMVYPLFGVLFLVAFFGERLEGYQWAGVLLLPLVSTMRSSASQFQKKRRFIELDTSALRA